MMTNEKSFGLDRKGQMIFNIGTKLM